MDIIAGLPERTPGYGRYPEADWPETYRQPDGAFLAIKRRQDGNGRLKREDGKTNEIMSGMIRSAERMARKDGTGPILSYRQKNIAKFRKSAMQRLTKREYTIYLLWRKAIHSCRWRGRIYEDRAKDMIPMPGSRKKKMTRLMRIENVKAIDAYRPD